MKNTIIILISIITFIFMAFIIVFGFIEIPKQFKNDADNVLETISKDIDGGNLKKSTVKKIKNDLFYVIWLKDKKNDIIPIIYDHKVFNINSKNPYLIQSDLKNKVFVYERTSNNLEYIVWINKYKIEYYMKNILIPILFIIIIYLFVVFIVSLFSLQNRSRFQNGQLISEKSVSNEEKDKNEPLSYELSSEEFNGLLGNSEDGTSDNPTEKNGVDDKILSDYKELWVKHFRISDDFKNNFPFEKVLKMVKFGIKPEDYIKSVLDISGTYFKWKGTKVFINQDDKFVDSITKEFLDTSRIDIPLKGDKKGEIFIPLYPYNLTTLFGYFSFMWEEEVDFKIADILYFLKLFFSDDAKNIFINYNDFQDTINNIKNDGEKKSLFLSLISVDNREKIKLKLKRSEKERLSKDILTNLKNDFSVFNINQIFDYYFCIYGEYKDKSQIINSIDDWIGDFDKHNYKISDKSGNLALTFSAGITFSTVKDFDVKKMIDKTTLNIENAIKQGGNQIVSD